MQFFNEPLREKCPNTSYLSVFSPNAGKYGPEITPYLDTFHAVNLLYKSTLFSIGSEAPLPSFHNFQDIDESKILSNFLLNLLSRVLAENLFRFILIFLVSHFKLVIFRRCISQITPS